ncbi:MAG: MlaD family protein [Spirochaetia bacterium]
MVTKAQKVRAGIFFTIGLVAIIVAIGVAIGTQLFEEREEYFIVFDDISVNGLQVGGQVKFRGITIGTIEEIQVSPEDITRIIVRIGVVEGTPIKEDMTATLSMVGVTGLMQIQLAGGSNEAETLEPGSTIEASESGIASLTGEAEIITEKFELLLNNLNSFTTTQNQQTFENILTTVDRILTNNEPGVNRVVSRLDEFTVDLVNATDNLDSASQRLLEITEGDEIQQIIDNSVVLSNESLELVNRLDTMVTESDLDETMNNLNSFSEDLASSETSEVLSEIRSILTQTRQTLNLVDLTIMQSSQDLIQAVSVLNETLENLNDFSRTISEDPSSLIQF